MHTPPGHRHRLSRCWRNYLHRFLCGFEAKWRLQGEEATPRRQGRERMDRFLCGLAAGMVAKLGTHPLDVAKKRFQVRRAQCMERA